MVLRFDRQMQGMGAAEFVDRLLVEGLGARHVVVGHDFRFARRREGTLATLREAGAQARIRRRGGRRVPASTASGSSSSLVREALGRGDLARAQKLLGRPYRMAGRVMRGQQLGRKLGYPTANLALHRKVVPLWGIFAVRVSGAGLVDHPAVVSLGTRPTVNGTDPLLEVHVFDFDGDLYGRYLDVDFVQRLRDEQRFESLDALVAQMHVDAAAGAGRAGHRRRRPGDSRVGIGGAAARFRVTASPVHYPPTPCSLPSASRRWPTTSTPSTCRTPPSR